MKLWDQLKTIVSFELFEALSIQFSGGAVCFSSTPRRGNALLAKEILGDEVNNLVAKHFYRHHGAKTVYFPKNRAATMEKRHSAILADYGSGLPFDEITIKHQISNRQMYQIINKARRAQSENISVHNRKAPRGVIATKERNEVIRTAARAGASFAFLSGRYGISKARVTQICLGIPDSGAASAQKAEQRVKQEVAEAFRAGKNPGQLAYLFNMPVISIKKILATMNQNGNQDQGATA